MATQEAPRTRPSDRIGVFLLILVCLAALVMFGLNIMDRLRLPLPALPTLPTAVIQVRPATRPQAAPVALPTPAPAEFAPVEVPLQNIAPADDPAPPVLQTKPVEREAAPDVLPTEDTGHGVKETGPFNPQLTHECRHGQQWVDGKGCKNVVTP